MKWRRLAHLFLMTAGVPLVMSMEMGCDGEPGAIATSGSPGSTLEVGEVGDRAAAAQPVPPAEKAVAGQDYAVSSSCSCNGVQYTCPSGSCFCSNGSGYCGSGGSVPSGNLPTNPFPTNPFPTNPFPTNPFPTNPFPTNPFPTNTGSVSSSCSCNGILYVCNSGSCFCSNGSGQCSAAGSNPGNSNPGNSSPDNSGGFPTCGPSAIDPDGDGWGWENNRSCRVGGGGINPGNTGSVSSSCSCNGVLYTCPSGSCFCSNGTGYCR